MKNKIKISSHILGRSMIEMLGVLAVIGILSAGAMAGYSKAMFKHRVNQTIDIFQGMLQRFSELDTKDWNDWDAIGVDGNGTPEDMVKYGFMDKCQTVETSSGEGCHLPIANIVMQFGFHRYLYGEFYIHFTDSKSCVAFLTSGIEQAVPVDWWSQGAWIDWAGGTTSGSLIYSPYNGINKIDIANITAGCQGCDDGGCSIEWTIRNEW